MPVKQSRSTEDYKKFRRKVTALRADFLDTRRKEEKMVAEDSTSQAAQEARMEREREASAFPGK